MNRKGSTINLRAFSAKDVAEAERRKMSESSGWSKLRIESILVLMGVITRNDINKMLREQGLEEIGDIEHAHTNLPVAVRFPIPWPPREKE